MENTETRCKSMNWNILSMSRESGDDSLPKPQPQLQLPYGRFEMREVTPGGVVAVFFHGVRRIVAFAWPAVLAAVLQAWPGYAYSNTCGNAAFQLTQYVAQVNQIANWEASQGIPMKCGWNQMCVQALLQQLNFWYYQQSNFVNMQYAQIARQCSGSPYPSQIDPRNPGRLEELEIDDEDRTVAIKIPGTPEGFQPQ